MYFLHVHMYKTTRMFRKQYLIWVSVDSAIHVITWSLEYNDNENTDYHNTSSPWTNYEPWINAPPPPYVYINAVI